MLYIDACSYDDYDQVIRFCLTHNITISSRDKMQMTIAAEMTEAQAKQMLDETIFQHAVSYGKSSLC